MGNCQAAEAATILIHHPAENKVERLYWSVKASDVMKSNPGNYVAVVVTSSPKSTKEKGSKPTKQLKLLRPDDALLIGHVYRLVSFEEVLNEFATKKCVKLGKLLKEGGGLELNKKKNKKKKMDQETDRVNPNDTVAGEDGGDGLMRRSHGGGRGGNGWRPALHSIPEFRSS